MRRLTPGETFAEKFSVERLLGRGAMGSVYLTVDVVSGEKRALKLMNPDLRALPRFIERFTQEAEIGARIASEHVVRVFEHGLDASSGIPWLAMEYVDGDTLDRAVEQGSLDAPARREVLQQLFRAIAAAHDVNIVHRDLKPENVLILRTEASALQIKVLDFGVAKVVRAASLSGTAEGLGTPLWAAPEQSESSKIIRPSADVWALGLLTFWLLTGKIFWLGAAQRTSMVELAYELIGGPIPPATERASELGFEGSLPPDFDAWFARAVARDPAARFTSAGEAFRTLEPILLVPPSPPSTRAVEDTPPRASEVPSPRKALAGRFVLLALGLVLLSVVVALFVRS